MCCLPFCDAAHRGHSTMRRSASLWSLLKEGHKWIASQWNSAAAAALREVDAHKHTQMWYRWVLVLWSCMNGENVCAHAGGTSKTDWTNSDASLEWRDSEDRATGLTNSRRHVARNAFVSFPLSLFLSLFRLSPILFPPSPLPNILCQCTTAAKTSLFYFYFSLEYLVFACLSATSSWLMIIISSRSFVFVVKIFSSSFSNWCYFATVLYYVRQRIYRLLRSTNSARAIGNASLEIDFFIERIWLCCYCRVSPYGLRQR